MNEESLPPLIVPWDQYRRMVKLGMIKKEEALKYLDEAEVDRLIKEGREEKDSHDAEKCL